MDIYITGSIKCRLGKLIDDNPYKIFSYEEIQEELFFDESLEFEIETLRSILENWARHFLQDFGQRQSFSRTLEDPEVLINYCAIFLIDDLKTKSAIMEANTLRDKIKKIIDAVGPKEIPLGPFLPSLRF
jgi:hypothetical protein